MIGAVSIFALCSPYSLSMLVYAEVGYSDCHGR